MGNKLNLITPPSTVIAARTITYTYDASGQKLRRVSTTGTGSTDYIKGIQYEGGTMTIIQTEEGRAVPAPAGANAYYYYYTLSDHLGNSRIMFDTHTGITATLQQDDYYPFGMEIGRTTPSTKNEYLYNKKELQEELGQLDYGARFYDPVIGRWSVVDPLAEKSRRFSGYNYVSDNPIRRIDPDGMKDKYFDDDGNYYGQDERGDNGRVRIVTNNKELKTLKESHDANKVINSEDIKSGVVTNNGALKEASAVLKETIKNNNGTEEQLSIVNNKDGSVTRADLNKGTTETASDGTTVATTQVKAPVGGQYTSIHSHTTGLDEGRNGNALVPGPGDPELFGKFGMNIIVGPLGQSYENSTPSNGAVFYDNSGTRKGQITSDALNNIINQLN